MRVLQVSKFYPPHHGGIEAVARDLTAGLVARGVAVSVLCANKKWQHVEEADAQGVPVVRAASAGLLLSTSMAPGMTWHLRRHGRQADVVHVHMPDPMAALAVYCARPRAKLVLHWHSDVVRQRKAMRLYKPLEQWLLRRADAVVATSQTYADSSASLQPWLHKVQVVPIGTPAPVPANPQRVQAVQQRYGGRRMVFSLGRMAHYKGYEVLLEAARHLPDDVVVVVGGGGPDLPRYRALAEQRGVADKVLFVGPMSAQGVEAHFAVAEVFCMASTVRAEAYGVAVLEAMARGLPVVASSIPGSGLNWLHQAGVTGLAVPPGNASALATALRTLLGDPELRRRFGEQGRQRWAAGLTAQTMADSMLKLYERLLVGHHHPSDPRNPD